MKRRLPLLVERTLADEHANVIEMSSTFEQKIQDVTLESQGTIMCSPGCANCCYHPFQVSVFQGLVVFEWLISHGRWTPALRQKVEAASDRTLALDLKVWLNSVLPCPLLNDKNRCTAYEGRPLHCRVTFATTLPEMCHPHNLARSHIIPRQEVLTHFHAREKGFLKRHGLRGFYMPLSTALLISEKIYSGEIDLDDADAELARKVQGVR